jgi:hypothetical protein
MKPDKKAYGFNCGCFWSKDIYPHSFKDGIEDNDYRSSRSWLRAFLLEGADSLLIPKFEARNVKMNRKEALIVLVDGEKEQIESFVRFVRENKPERAVVEEHHVIVRDIKKFRMERL